MTLPVFAVPSVGNFLERINDQQLLISWLALRRCGGVMVLHQRGRVSQQNSEPVGPLPEPQRLPGEVPGPLPFTLLLAHVRHLHAHLCSRRAGQQPDLYRHRPSPRDAHNYKLLPVQLGHFWPPRAAAGSPAGAYELWSNYPFLFGVAGCYFKPACSRRSALHLCSTWPPWASNATERWCILYRPNTWRRTLTPSALSSCSGPSRCCVPCPIPVCMAWRR